MPLVDRILQIQLCSEKSQCVIHIGFNDNLIMVYWYPLRDLHIHATIQISDLVSVMLKFPLVFNNKIMTKEQSIMFKYGCALGLPYII